MNFFNINCFPPRRVAHWKKGGHSQVRVESAVGVDPDSKIVFLISTLELLADPPAQPCNACTVDTFTIFVVIPRAGSY
jgi:hypothetical protein